MKKLFLFFITAMFVSLINSSYAQQRLGSPIHLFFEYGPLSKVPDGSTTKGGSHFSVGVKKHPWIEDRPMQFEFEINYRSITFYDSSEVKNKFGMAEGYIGPRFWIPKMSPFYPTLSVLGGGYTNLGSVGGLSALFTIGFYYNFTPAGSLRNGCSVEFTYHTAKIKYNGLSIPPAFAIRIGFYL